MNNVPHIQAFYTDHIVDEDFDEIFYQKQYPDTKDFYQPACANHGIDDRHRLYFHWWNHNKKGFKNLVEQQSNSLQRHVEPRKRLNKLAVVTSFFNPCNYTNIYNNYLIFASNIQTNADLFTIELSFNNRFAINSENTIHINGTSKNICWQKEALLNILIQSLPKEYTDVAWVDCDILFNENHWVDKLFTSLDKYKVVQIFSNVYKTNIDGNSVNNRSAVSMFPNVGEFGFAWAARREVLDEIQLLDNQIFGGADMVMASAFMNRPSLISNSNYINNNTTKTWLAKATEIVNESVSYVDTNITHLYHGCENNRIFTRTKKRQNLINSINFAQEVKKENNIWSISEKHSQNIYDFFVARKEDDNLRIKQFLEQKFQNHENLIDQYMTLCDTIMFTSPSIISKITDKLKTGIIDYSKKNSNIYCNYTSDHIFTRQDLLDSQKWLCHNIHKDRILQQHTSGSTTGTPFDYYGDTKYFDYIQKVSEFELILKEFDLYNKPLKILNLFKHQFNPQPTGFFLETKNYSKCRFHTYGADDATTYFINWDEYIEDPDQWHQKFLNFLSEHYFDIVLCSGPVINILTRYIKQYNFNHKFAYLLSHTTQFARINDFEYLKNHSYINHYCDHMRCYDGGANFFTCKFGTYHLNDHLSWVEQGPDNKMISTDYFNMVSPFVNYWNGDLCEIENEYQLCNCGRWYRPFKMLQNRPFALKGPTQLTEIREKIKRLEFKSSIDQVQFENLTANVYLNDKLNERCIDILKDILCDYEVKIYE